MSDPLEVFKDLLEFYYLVYRLEENNVGNNGEILDRTLNILEELLKYQSKIWSRILYRAPIELLLLNESHVGKRKAKLLLRSLRNLLEKEILKITRIIRSVKSEEERIILPPMFYHNPIKLFNAFDYFEGRNRYLIIAAHSTPPLEDAHTVDIASKIAKITGSHLLISKISRVDYDYNSYYSRISPFRRLIERLIFSNRVKFIIDIHGYNIPEEYDVRLGFGTIINKERKTVKRLLQSFEEQGLNTIVDTSRFHGGDIVFYHSIPPKINAVQVEINVKTRKHKRNKVINALVNFMGVR